jgi:serine/threonine-protein kinase
MRGIESRRPTPPPVAISPAEHLTGLEVIGHGGMGIVYKAHDARRNEIVAVKVLHQDLCANPTFVSRFLREAESLAQLSHPNIVKGYEVGGAARAIYFTMEYVDGPDLARLSAAHGPLAPRLALQVLKQAARALSYAYAKGKIHRDIKPANLLLTTAGQVKLSDFGLIKSEDDPGLTGAAPIMGTPYYMSPEIASGCQDIDIRADIYSLGTTVFHLLTGRPPFAGQDPPVVMTRQITDAIELPEIGGHGTFGGRADIGGHDAVSCPQDPPPKFADRFRYILSKMLSKRRELRYQTPDELLADLEKVEDVGDTIEYRAVPAFAAPTTPPPTTANRLFSAPTVPALQPRLDSVLEQFQIRLGDTLQDRVAPNSLVTRTYSSGTVLFYEGDDSRDFYVLNSGKCEVLRSGKRLATIDQPGASFGEISAILGGRRTATIRALTKTVCTIVPLEQLKTFLAKNPDVQKGVLEVALTRLKDLNERYVRSQNAAAIAKSRLLRLSRQLAILSSAELAASVNAISDALNASQEQD